MVQAKHRSQRIGYSPVIVFHAEGDAMSFKARFILCIALAIPVMIVVGYLIYLYVAWGFWCPHYKDYCPS
jgi:hypothetical protein